MNMNIKEVYEVTGLSADTIRYYDVIELVPKLHENLLGVRDLRKMI